MSRSNHGVRQSNESFEPYFLSFDEFLDLSNLRHAIYRIYHQKVDISAKLRVYDSLEFKKLHFA
ncbi:hypothetical protein [Paenibacillus gansuensis]|uniref:Uncharacterized protein n=1 Tax=Paenibacillus gansuensis TaxID=306542 RepID=A0ABW5P9V0_9BACL